MTKYVIDKEYADKIISNWKEHPDGVEGDVEHSFFYKDLEYDSIDRDRGDHDSWKFLVNPDDEEIWVAVSSDPKQPVFIYDKYGDWRRRIDASNIDKMKEASKEISDSVKMIEEEIKRLKEIANKNGISFSLNVGAYNSGHYDPDEGGWTGAWDASTC